jgi:transcriptional regulator GlxA family with amidase domain
MNHITVYVVLLQRTLLLDAAGPLEVLRVANREQQKIRFEVHYVGPEASIVSSIGITLAEIEPLPKTLPDGAMVVLSGDVDYMMMPGIQVAPRQVGDRDAVVVKWLRTVVRPGHKVVSICSGALLAGKAGLLDGYACTTHHSSCAELAAIAPKAKVLENRLFVEDRERYTSAGVTAGVDLMLHIVAQLTDLALAVSIARWWCICAAVDRIRSFRRGWRGATIFIRRCTRYRTRLRPIQPRPGRYVRWRESGAQAAGISRGYFRSMRE